MTAKQLTARAVVVTVGAALAAMFLIGAYQDLGSWTAVATVLAVFGTVGAALVALAWGLTNWNAR